MAVDPFIIHSGVMVAGPLGGLTILLGRARAGDERARGEALAQVYYERRRVTGRPDEMWGADMRTTVTTKEGQVCSFVAADDWTSECTGIHASLSGNRFEALEPNLLDRPVMARIFTGDERLQVAEDGSTSAVASDEDEA